MVCFWGVTFVCIIVVKACKTNRDKNVCNIKGFKTNIIVLYLAVPTYQYRVFVIFSRFESSLTFAKVLILTKNNQQHKHRFPKINKNVNCNR